MSNILKSSLWHKSNKIFLRFLLRFILAFLSLTLTYELYLHYTNEIGSLDAITYFISRGSFEMSKQRDRLQKAISQATDPTMKAKFQQALDNLSEKKVEVDDDTDFKVKLSHLLDKHVDN